MCFLAMIISVGILQLKLIVKDTVQHYWLTSFAWFVTIIALAYPVVTFIGIAVMKHEVTFGVLLTLLAIVNCWRNYKLLSEMDDENIFRDTKKKIQ